MKRNNKKAFTIVELVIVIAVIAVLAAVLIPTFTSVVDKANESAALQEVQNAYIDALAKALGSKLTGKSFTSENGFTFTFSDETGQNATIEGPPGFKYTAKVENGVVVLGPASGGNGGGAGGGTGGVTTVGEFKTALAAALETGGTVNLGDSIEITEAISIPSEATATINLAGYTLTLKDNAEPSEDDASNVITVANGGVLTISNTGVGGGIVIEEPTYEYYWMSAYAGILVEAGGKLELDGVKLTINAYHTAIANNGEATLKNGANVTVTGGFGLYNDGTGTATISSAAFTVNDSGTGVVNTGVISIADNTTFTINSGEEYYPTFGVENCGVATITGGSFVASGTHVTSVRNHYKAADPYYGSPEYIGKMTITGTVFSEAEDSTYEHFAPIEHSGGTSVYDHASECYLVLEGVQVSSSQNSVYVDGSGKVVINSGVFNSQLKIPAAITYIAIYGGTFHNGTAEVAFEDLECVHSVDNQPDCGIFVADNSGGHGMHKYSDEGDRTCWYICYDDVKSQLPGTLIEEAPTP